MVLRYPKQDGERKAVASELGREETRASPARKQSSHMHCRFLLQRGEKRGGGKWQQEGEQAGEVRNPASSDLPTLLASPLCAVPHLTVIREPTGRVEAGRPEEWENRDEGCAHRDVCLDLWREGPQPEAVPAPKLPESLEHQMDLRTANTLLTPKAPEVPSKQSPHV